MGYGAAAGLCAGGDGEGAAQVGRGGRGDLPLCPQAAAMSPGGVHPSWDGCGGCAGGGCSPTSDLQAQEEPPPPSTATPKLHQRSLGDTYRGGSPPSTKQTPVPKALGGVPLASPPSQAMPVPPPCSITAPGLPLGYNNLPISTKKTLVSQFLSPPHPVRHHRGTHRDLSLLSSARCHHQTLPGLHPGVQYQGGHLHR